MMSSLESRHLPRSPTGHRIDIGSFAAEIRWSLDVLAGESHVNAGVISLNTYVYVLDFFGGAGKQPSFPYPTKTTKPPNRLEKGCWEKLLQPLLSWLGFKRLFLVFFFYSERHPSAWLGWKLLGFETRTAASCHPHWCVSKSHHPTLNESISDMLKLEMNWNDVLVGRIEVVPTIPNFRLVTLKFTTFLTDDRNSSTNHRQYPLQKAQNTVPLSAKMPGPKGIQEKLANGEFLLCPTRVSMEVIVSS